MEQTVCALCGVNVAIGEMHNLCNGKILKICGECCDKIWGDDEDPEKEVKPMNVDFEGLPEFSGFEQIKFETAYKHRVPFFTEELLDKGCTEILITKVDDGWDLVGKKPINYDE